MPQSPNDSMPDDCRRESERASRREPGREYCLVEGQSPLDFQCFSPAWRPAKHWETTPSLLLVGFRVELIE